MHSPTVVLNMNFKLNSEFLLSAERMMLCPLGKFSPAQPEIRLMLLRFMHVRQSGGKKNICSSGRNKAVIVGIKLFCRAVSRSLSGPGYRLTSSLLNEWMLMLGAVGKAGFHSCWSERGCSLCFSFSEGGGGGRLKSMNLLNETCWNLPRTKEETTSNVRWCCRAELQ